ncbi:MAG TPA: hypothetical protein VIC08_09820, partial [Cellvibrionaceae bacterium]
MRIKGVYTVVSINQAQQGLALALMLWFVAALALLVSGLALTAKTDISYTRVHLAQAEAEAAADGAALIYLAQLTSMVDEELSGPARVQIGKYLVYLRLVPASGLIDYRQASEQTLTQLFTTAAGLDPADAAILSQSVVQWRALEVEQKQHQAAGEAVGINVLEDIMAAPGLTREIFDRIKLLITVRGQGTDVDTNTAPLEVLEVLAMDDGSQVDHWLAERTDNAAPTSQLLTTGPLRVDARVETGAGIYQRSLWMTPGGNSAFGWKVER